MLQLPLRALPIAAALALTASVGHAQSFEVFPEGFSSIFLPAGFVTLTDLDQGLGTAPDPFVIDDATGGLLRYDVGSPAVNNVVSFGGYVPGGDNLYGRCKSFRMFFAQPLPSVFFTMWISRAQAGNSIRFDLRSGGQTMGSFDIPIPAGTAPFCLRLNPFLPNMEEIVVTGIGPHDGGAFHGVIDGMLFGVVVDYAPTCDGGVSPIHAPCPCGNDSNVYDSEGCLSSFGYGGRLRMSGYPSISNDSVQLVCMQLPPSASALFFQGTQDLTFTGGAVFGDGVRCAAGNVVRLGVKQAVNGIAAYPEAGDVPISIRGGVTQGSVRAYQVWFRNVASFCTPAAYNLSNGMVLGWGS